MGIFHIYNYHLKPTLLPSKEKHLPITPSMLYTIFGVPQHGILGSILTMVLFISLKPSLMELIITKSRVRSTPFWDSDLESMEWLAEEYYSILSSRKNYTDKGDRVDSVKICVQSCVYQWLVSRDDAHLNSGCFSAAYFSQLFRFVYGALFWWKLTDPSGFPIV